MQNLQENTNLTGIDISTVKLWETMFSCEIYQRQKYNKGSAKSDESVKFTEFMNKKWIKLWLT